MLQFLSRAVSLRNVASWSAVQCALIYEQARIVAAQDMRVSVILCREAEDIASEVRMMLMATRDGSKFRDSGKLVLYVRQRTKAYIRQSSSEQCAKKRVWIDLDSIAAAEDPADGPDV